MVDDTGFPKQGDDSVGVDRQYSGTLGKTGNCQVAVSLHHVGEQGNAVLGWRLYLPETWTKDPEKRQAAGVPEEVVFKKKWELALELLDQVRGWGLADRIVLAMRDTARQPNSAIGWKTGSSLRGGDRVPNRSLG